MELLRLARKCEQPRTGSRFFKPLRQIIESSNVTLKGQLDLEQQGGTQTRWRHRPLRPAYPERVPPRPTIGIMPKSPMPTDHPWP